MTGTGFFRRTRYSTPTFLVSSLLLNNRRFRLGTGVSGTVLQYRMCIATVLYLLMVLKLFLEDPSNWNNPASAVKRLCSML